MIDSGGRIRFYLVNTYPTPENYIFVQTGYTYNDGNWHHLVVTYDGSSSASGVKMYVDGSQVSLTILKDTLSETIQVDIDLLIGGWGSAQQPRLLFKGLIDELLIYTRVLSSDDIAIRYNSGNGQLPYSTSNPIIYPKSSIRTDEIISLSETSTKPSGTDIKYIIKVNDTDYYWNGSSWVQSDGSYSQANTIDEVNNNLNNFPGNPSEVYVKAILHSDGFNSPELSELEVNYDYVGSDKDDITVCTVTGWITDIANDLSDIDNVPIKVSLCKSTVRYRDNIILINETKTFYSNSNGYFELKLVENENMESGSYYIVNINNRLFRIKVPNKVGCSFQEIII